MYHFLVDRKVFTFRGKVIERGKVVIAASKRIPSAEVALNRAFDAGAYPDAIKPPFDRGVRVYPNAVSDPDPPIWDYYCYHFDPVGGWFTKNNTDVGRGDIIEAAGEGNPFALDALDDAYNHHDTDTSDDTSDDDRCCWCGGDHDQSECDDHPERNLLSLIVEMSGRYN